MEKLTQIHDSDQTYIIAYSIIRGKLSSKQYLKKEKEKKGSCTHHFTVLTSGCQIEVDHYQTPKIEIV